MSGAHIAAHAAIEKRRREHEEEERMTRYSNTELEQDWEFKIVRSTTGAFKKPEVFGQLLEQEAIAGWVLLEKLDDGRVRLKRPVSARRRDDMLPAGIDPYRTQHGISEGWYAFWIVAGVILAILLMIGIIMLAEAGAIF